MVAKTALLALLCCCALPSAYNFALTDGGDEDQDDYDTYEDETTEVVTKRTTKAPCPQILHLQSKTNMTFASIGRAFVSCCCPWTRRNRVALMKYRRNSLNEACWMSVRMPRKSTYNACQDSLLRNVTRRSESHAPEC
uniref:Putative secreted protein n=1 Tax=Amblyomma parvum TaxID=251391 RepID=A0A023G2E7_AMBPA